MSARGALTFDNPAALARHIEERTRIHGQVRFARARQNVFNNLLAGARSVTQRENRRSTFVQLDHAGGIEQNVTVAQLLRAHLTSRRQPNAALLGRCSGAHGRSFCKLRAKTG